MSRRTTRQIVHDIMKAMASGESRPTRIMYAANISWLPLEKHLKALIGQGLVEQYEPGRGDKRVTREFRLTGEGNSTLVRLNEYERLFKNVV